MTTKLLRARSPADLVARGGDAFTLAIARDSGVAWRLRVLAHLEHGAREAGVIYTSPRSTSGGAQSRVIATGCLPGAREWSVEAECLNVAGASPDIELDLSVGTSGQTPSFTDLEVRRRNYYSGTFATVTLQPWQRLLGWSAKATGAGASVQMNGGAVIAVAAGSAAASNNLALWGAVLIFTATAEYIVEYEG